MGTSEFYTRQVERLIRASTDPAHARKLYERDIVPLEAEDKRETEAARLWKLKALLWDYLPADARFMTTVR